MSDKDKNKDQSKSKSPSERKQQSSGRKQRRGENEESPSGRESLRAADSVQSQSTALSMKRRHVYDSLEHCRAAQTMGTNKLDSTSGKSTDSKKKSDPFESSVNTAEYIGSLQSKSNSRSGRYHDTSMDGKLTNLKISSWNINGLRSWLKKRSGLTFIAQDDADIYCFQETKCDNSNLPAEIKRIPGYSCYWNGSNDRHSGVVCFTKREPKNVTYGIGSSIFDREGRVITLDYADYFVVNVYVPNSGRKLARLDYRLKWDESFYEYIKRLDTKKPVIVCGDLNVSHQEIDLANPKANTRTAGYTQEERDNFTRLLDDLSLVDVFRYLNPVKRNCYTYWTYMRSARERNIGWRLDYFLISRRWMEKTCDCIIRNDVYGSDHCPLSMFLAI